MDSEKEETENDEDSKKKLNEISVWKAEKIACIVFGPIWTLFQTLRISSLGKALHCPSLFFKRMHDVGVHTFLK